MPTIPAVTLLPPPQGKLIPPNSVETITLNLATVNSMVEKVVKDTAETSCDPVLITSLNSICEALKLLSENQREIISANIPQPPQSNWIPVVARGSSYAVKVVAKKSRTEPSPSEQYDRREEMTALPIPKHVSLPNPQTTSQKPVSNDPPEIQKFKDTVREAEKSTLIFNLDMGRVPLLNKDTISKKATLALTTMAAKVENSNTSLPSKETVTAIDDVLSVINDMTLYGSVTKSYNNPKDEASGSFCTIPVRYDFKDRETRIQAESILRKACNIKCATPYPVVLRECVKQTGSFFRGLYNTDYVRVGVEISRMALRVSYKSDKDSPWAYHDKLIAIPAEALDVNARRVPLGFKMSGLIPDTESMDFGEVGGAGAISRSESGSPRLSRKDSAGKSPNKKRV
jgi:hypothetical protein